MCFPSKLDYQRQFIIASLDDFTPNSTLSKFHGGQYGTAPALWRSAVIDFLCMSLRCGLIEATHRSDISARDVEYLRNLLIYGDSKSGMDLCVLWNALYFNGTPQLDVIIKECGLYGWEALRAGESEELIKKLTEHRFVF